MRTDGTHDGPITDHPGDYAYPWDDKLDIDRPIYQPAYSTHANDGDVVTADIEFPDPHGAGEVETATNDRARAIALARRFAARHDCRTVVYEGRSNRSPERVVWDSAADA